MADPLDDETGYSYLAEAATAARAASRRYWAPGGEADRRFPVAKDMDRMWPLYEIEGRTEPKTERGTPG